MPRPTTGGEQGGIIMGGAAVYISKQKADKEKQAAWKFVQFLAQPKQQAFFHIGTGYFPIRKDAYDLPEVKDNMAKYPQFQTAVDQLHANPANPATSGAVLGVFTAGAHDRQRGRDRGDPARQVHRQGRARQGRRELQQGAGSVQRLGEVTGKPHPPAPSPLRWRGGSSYAWRRTEGE